MENFKNFKTGNRVIKRVETKDFNMNLIGLTSMEFDEYKANVFDLLTVIIELERKKRIYQSLFGILFLNGKHKAEIIDKEIDIIKNSINISAVWTF